MAHRFEDFLSFLPFGVSYVPGLDFGCDLAWCGFKSLGNGCSAIFFNRLGYVLFGIFLKSPKWLLSLFYLGKIFFFLGQL